MEDIAGVFAIDCCPKHLWGFTPSIFTYFHFSSSSLYGPKERTQASENEIIPRRRVRLPEPLQLSLKKSEAHCPSPTPYLNLIPDLIQYFCETAKPCYIIKTSLSSQCHLEPPLSNPAHPPERWYSTKQRKKIIKS